MREIFSRKMEEINNDVMLMGGLVQEAVDDAVKAFMEMDAGLAQKVIERDVKIDEMDISIEEKCIIIQAEHQPVARDLRYLHSICVIIKSLERIGDLAVNAAKVVKKMEKNKLRCSDREIINLIVEMGSIVKSELNGAIESFKNKSIKIASKLEKSDDTVDGIQKMILKKLFSSYKSKKDINIVTSIVMASRYLERIGDQSVNIGERVRYFLSGDYEVIRDSE
jgi:phosphate transport system protein